MNRRRLFALALLVWTSAALTRAIATLPDRLGRAALTGTEPINWLRTSPEVSALERFLADQSDELRLGVTVRVAAEAGAGVDASLVWHWAQYLAPRANFLWSGDVDAAYPTELALTWGPVEAAAGWRLIARDGSVALYRVAEIAR